jgi:hypothetical protein
MARFTHWFDNKKKGLGDQPFSTVTSHYVIDQTTISICDIEKLFGCEVKQNPLDTTWTPMYIKLYDIFQQKLNIVNKITSGPCRH